MFMASKTITITDEAYDFLKAMKKGEESFSDVILGLKGRKEALLQYWGMFAGSDLPDAKTLRDEMNRGLDERTEGSWR